MFYYISFLRPPLNASAFSQPVTLAPQVSNDLRTEPFPASLDVYCHWSTSPAHSAPAALTKSVKLTTWRQENTYKAISVPPPSLRTTECALVLTSTPARGAYSIDLRDAGIGSQPFPVFSMPIRFSNKPASTKKQESVERYFRLFDAEESGMLKIREMTSFDLDKKLWDSGVGLSAWLVSLFQRKTDELSLEAQMRDRIFGNTCRAIELGAGTGMVSLVLAALRSDGTREVGGKKLTRILSTDLPSSIELMEHNIEVNTGLYGANGPSALILDWEEDLPKEVTEMVTEGLDVIIMADVTYNTASFPFLLRTLSALLSSSREPLVLFAYKERDLAERELWDKLRDEVGVLLEKVGTTPGAGGREVEMWVGRCAQQC